MTNMNILVMTLSIKFIHCGELMNHNIVTEIINIKIRTIIQKRVNILKTNIYLRGNYPLGKSHQGPIILDG